MKHILYLVIIFFSSLFFSSFCLEIKNLDRLKLLLKSKEQQIVLLEKKVDSLRFLKEKCPPDLNFGIYSSPSKSRVLRGENFETELGLKVLQGVKILNIKVNEKDLPLKDGKAIFKSKRSVIGEKRYHVQTIFEHPIRKKIDTLNQDFIFEVDGQMTTIAHKNNRILYAFQDNEISIGSNESVIWGLSPRVIKGSAKIKRLSANKYSINPRYPDSTITLQLKNSISGKYIGSPVTFYVRRVHDILSYPQLSNSFSEKEVREIKAEELREQIELKVCSNQYDYKFSCNIWEYTLKYTPKNGKTQTYFGSRGTFKGAIFDLIQNTKAGDTFYFYDIKSSCPISHNYKNKTADVLYKVI